MVLKYPSTVQVSKVYKLMIQYNIIIHNNARNMKEQQQTEVHKNLKQSQV